LLVVAITNIVAEFKNESLVNEDFNRIQVRHVFVGNTNYVIQTNDIVDATRTT
jgi:hypothetical protein